MSPDPATKRPKNPAIQQTKSQPGWELFQPSMEYTLLDVRASGQTALIPLGAHRVCSTLPTGVWLLNGPWADVDVEGRDLTRLLDAHSAGRIPPGLNRTSGVDRATPRAQPTIDSGVSPRVAR